MANADELVVKIGADYSELKRELGHAHGVAKERGEAKVRELRDDVVEAEDPDEYDGRGNKELRDNGGGMHGLLGLEIERMGPRGARGV